MTWWSLRNLRAVIECRQNARKENDIVYCGRLLARSRPLSLFQSHRGLRHGRERANSGSVSGRPKKAVPWNQHAGLLAQRAGPRRIAVLSTNIAVRTREADAPKRLCLTSILMVATSLTGINCRLKWPGSQTTKAFETLSSLRVIVSRAMARSFGVPLVLGGIPHSPSPPKVFSECEKNRLGKPARPTTEAARPACLLRGRGPRQHGESCGAPRSHCTHRVRSDRRSRACTGRQAFRSKSPRGRDHHLRQGAAQARLGCV